MKNVLPLILFAAGCITANAAPLQKNTSSQHVAMYSAILQKQAATSPAYKTTATQKRIIANSYVASGVLTDSNHYYYSNGRGFIHTDVNSFYDNFYITAINPVQSIFSDSSVNWHNGTMGLYRTGTKAYTYDANLHITNMGSYSPWYRAMYVPVYSSSTGLLTSLTISDTSGGTGMIPKQRMYMFYDGQGRRIYDSTYSVTLNAPLNKRMFTYDANGNMLKFETSQLVSGTWATTYRNTNTYDVANRLVTSVAELDFTGAGLVNSNKDSFGYTGSSVNPSFHIDYSWDDVNSLWQDQEIIRNQYNAQGLLDTYYIVRYTTQWDTIERDVHIYDSNGLLLRSNGYAYNGNGVFSATPYDQSLQYYEDYFPAGISNTTVDNDGIVIFPNPSTGFININTGIVETGSVAIFNMNGQLMYNTSSRIIDKQVIDIRQYPAGNYIIQIKDDNGQQLYRQRFSKI